MTRKASHSAGSVAQRACAFALSLVCAAAPCGAYAAQQDSASQANEYVSRIEETYAAYKEAEQTVRDLESQIASNEQREAELKAELPAQQAIAAASIKSMYLFQQSSGSLLELILSSEDFGDFVATVRYLDAIHNRNVEQIRALNEMVDELARTQAQLVADRDAAVGRREEAIGALEQARAARMELQSYIATVAASEESGRTEAVAKAKAALEAATVADPNGSSSAASATFTTTSGNEAAIEVPANSGVSTEPLVTNTTSDETADWAARIDEYLKGSPLEGYGATFAEAAATYGVDPRLSPAIATIESGKGTYCFQDHNAWGWGSSGWDSWETAIYEQVEGLATGYDGTLTLEGAERYCPPNYQEWYSSVASEMDGI